MEFDVMAILTSLKSKLAQNRKDSNILKRFKIYTLLLFMKRILQGKAQDDLQHTSQSTVENNRKILGRLARLPGYGPTMTGI